MFVALRVCRIDSLSRLYSLEELQGIRIVVSSFQGDVTIADFKQRVAAETGIPAARHRYYGTHRYYGASESTRSGWRFATDEILRGEDGRNFRATRKDLVRCGKFESGFSIGVVFLPPDADPHSDGGDADVTLVRRVDTVAQRIEAGRTNAIEVDDDSVELPQPKRQRRGSTAHSGAGAGVRNSSSGGAGMGRAQVSRPHSEGRERDGENRSVGVNAINGEHASASAATAAAGAGNVTVDAQDEEEGNDDEQEENLRNDAQPEEEAINADEAGETVGPAAAVGLNARQPEGRAGDNGDGPENGADGGADATVADADGAGEARAAAAVGAEHRGETPHSIQQWLQSLEVDGTPDGRFTRYAPAFEREFGSLRDLALAADEPGGMDGILRDCGVDRRGDRAGIRWAVSKLPRPE